MTDPGSISTKESVRLVNCWYPMLDDSEGEKILRIPAIKNRFALYD